MSGSAFGVVAGTLPVDDHDALVADVHRHRPAHLLRLGEGRVRAQQLEILRAEQLDHASLALPGLLGIAPLAVVEVEGPAADQGDVAHGGQVAAAVAVLVGFAGLTIPAKAQAVDGLIVKIPFEFAAAGKTFPAGEYRITRLRDEEPRILLFTSMENRSDVVMLRAESVATPDGKSHLGFTTVGDQRLLSRIQTRDYAYTFAVPTAEALLAATPRQGAAASSGSN